MVAPSGQVLTGMPLMAPGMALMGGGGGPTGPGSFAVSGGRGNGLPIASRPVHILLVDDEIYLLRTLTRHLRRRVPLEPEQILQAQNVITGKEVFDANQDTIGAILSDIMMPPGEMGIALYRHVRKTHTHVLFAFWSGGMPGDVHREMDRILQEDRLARFLDKGEDIFGNGVEIVDPLTAWFRGALLIAGGG